MAFSMISSALLVIATLLSYVSAAPAPASSTATATTSSPCAAASAAQASYLDAYPDATSFRLPANITYQCISSIPLQNEYSTRLVNDLKAWFEIETQIDYLKAPASGYLWDPIDLWAELDRIASFVQNNTYASQYDFEVDLITFSLQFHDFHTVLVGAISSTATWQRPTYLLSTSPDGIQMPAVYVYSDIVGFDAETNSLVQASVSSDSISAVQSVNGIAVQEFLQTQQLVAFSHDPDSMYNQLFLSVSQSLNPGGAIPATFSSPSFYPGGQTIFKFENGTSGTLDNRALTTCSLDGVTTGQEYWDTCVYSGETSTTTSVPSATSSMEVTPQTVTATTSATAVPAITQLPNHPSPIAVDYAGILSGYYLDGYDDVAVLVLRSFEGTGDDYLVAFQNTLEEFLNATKQDGKQKLIIDVQGNGGGYIDLGTELLAQLFPNVPPNQKGNYRTSLGYGLVLEKYGKLLSLADAQPGTDTEDELINEAENNFAWQSFMTPNVSEFTSFSNFYGPYPLGNGNYTSFFQSNYSNTDPSEFDAEGIQITGYGERTLPANTPPPFDPENIIILSDGFCGSTCSNTFEILTNAHSIPAISVGGRPQTGPMQADGNTKGSQVFQAGALGNIIDTYLNTTDGVPIDYNQVEGTVFENWDRWPVDQGILVALNAKNNYRIGDQSQTPLQEVYTAADCKIWYTPDMVLDMSAVWTRVADVAFDSSRKTLGAAGGPYTSKYCVANSTGHGSSVTGGLKQGSLGDQTPPANARPQYLGWLKDGTQIVQGFSLVSAGVGGSSSNTSKATTSTPNKLSVSEMKVGLSSLHDACAEYQGDKWLVNLICGAVG